MTAANREEALRVAERLVGSQLAACVQILPAMESVYRWKGEIERQAEILLIAKTMRSKFEELELFLVSCAAKQVRNPWCRSNVATDDISDP